MNPKQSPAKVLATGLIAATSALPVPAPAQERDFPQAMEVEGLVQDWAPAFETAQLPGMAFVVVRDGELAHLETWGVRNDAGDPVTPDTGFYIASITKTYVAFAIQMLAERGAVDLERPVQDYLPRFTLADAEAAAGITVRDLLCHAPGVSCGPAVILDAYTGQITEDRFYHFLAQTSPRGRTAYSNTHFTLAGRVVEAVTGQKWQDYLAEQLFTPAGMTRTTAYASRLYGDPDAALPMVAGSDGPRLNPQRKNDHTMHAAGGMGTTARDMARYLLLNLGLGRLGDATLMPPDRCLEMQSQASTAPERRSFPDTRLVGFGLGWMMGDYRGEPVLAHGGGYTGASAYMMFLPEQDLGVGYLANTSGAGAQVVQEFTAEVLDRMLGLESRDRRRTSMSRAKAEQRRRRGTGAPDSEPPTLSLPTAAYVGRYSNPHWGTIELEQGPGERLQGTMGAVQLRLAAAATPDQAELESAVTDPGDLLHFVVEAGSVRGLRTRIQGRDLEFARER